MDRARLGKAGALWEKDYPAITAVNGMFEMARKLDAGMVKGLAAVFEAMVRLLEEVG